MAPKYKYGPVEKSGKRKRYERVPANMVTYIAGAPCLNPNCHSHGKPHPNCKCYGAFAKGGAVEYFCSEARMHNPDCEYFKDGGEVIEAPTSLKEVTAIEAPADLKEASGSNSVVEAPDSLKEISAPPSGNDSSEQLKAGLEGISQGLIGDLAKVVQVKTGISKLEDIERREKEYGTTHDIAKGAAFAGSMFAGPAKAITTSVGSKILGNVLAATAYSMSDQTAKAFLGQPGGDVGSVVAGTLARGGLEGLINTATDGLFSLAPKFAKPFVGEKAVRVAENLMLDIAEKPVNRAITIAAAKNIGGAGVLQDIAEYKALKDWASPKIEKIIGKSLTKANQYVGDAILNVLAKTEFLGIPAIMRFAERASHGLASPELPINALFKSGTHHVVDKASESVVKEIEDWMESGGIEGEIQKSNNSPAFAQGGEVQNQGRYFEKIYPAENIMINQAIGRVSGYLNNLRPSKIQTKLPFDRDPSQKQKEKSYKKAVELAANPMSILNGVNSGRLTTEDMAHFKSMWPEVYELLSKKMTERISKAQLDGEVPTYSKRKAMSLFLGCDLDSTTSPIAIASVQGLYSMRKQQAIQAVQGSKKALAKSSSSYQTPEQSREKRTQNQKA